MQINVFDKITLSNHEKYIVISKIVYEQDTYYYLINEQNKTDIKICYENISNQSMIEIKNKEMIEKLFPLFLKNSQKEIAELLVKNDKNNE